MVVANRHPLPYRGDFDATRQVVFSKRLQPPPMPALLVLPLIVHDKPLGTLVLGSKRKGTFSDALTDSNSPSSDLSAVTAVRWPVV